LAGGEVGGAKYVEGIGFPGIGGLHFARGSVYSRAVERERGGWKGA
jgi:hypothetical protein